MKTTTVRHVTAPASWPCGRARDYEIWDDVVKDVMVGTFGLDPEMFVVAVKSAALTLTSW